MESQTKNNMKGYIYDRSSPTGFSFKDNFDIPKISGNQVLVDVHAVALNPIDYKLAQIMGRLVNKNFVSQDFAGVVIDAPKGSEFKIGDPVFGMAKQTMAEKILVDPQYITHMPNNISFVEAASIPLAGQTALQSLRDAGKVKPNSKVLILGASGGCGFLGTQIAKILGASQVTGVCSAKNIEFVKSMGATDIHDYTSSEGSLPKVQENDGYDCVFDTVSSPEDTNYRPTASKLLKPKSGQYVSINGTKTEWTRAMLSKAFGKWVQGSNYELVLLSKNRKDLDTLAGWLKEGKLKPVIDSEYEFTPEGVKHAFEKLKSRRAVGKVVVKFK